MKQESFLKAFSSFQANKQEKQEFCSFPASGSGLWILREQLWIIESPTSSSVWNKSRLLLLLQAEPPDWLIGCPSKHDVTGGWGLWDWDDVIKICSFLDSTQIKKDEKKITCAHLYIDLIIYSFDLHYLSVYSKMVKRFWLFFFFESYICTL